MTRWPPRTAAGPPSGSETPPVGRQRARGYGETAGLRRELVGRPVAYMVENRESRTGRMYENVLWLWPAA